VQLTVDFTKSRDSNLRTGILIWQDESHFLRLENNTDGVSGIKLELANTNLDGSSIYYDTPDTGKTPTVTELKIQRFEDNFIAYWKEPHQSNWQTVNTALASNNVIASPLSNLRVGLYLVSAASSNSVTASYQHFIVSCD